MDLAAARGLDRHVVYARVVKLGWTVEDALSRSVRAAKRRRADGGKSAIDERVDDGVCAEFGGRGDVAGERGPAVSRVAGGISGV